MVFHHASLFLSLVGAITKLESKAEVELDAAFVLLEGVELDAKKSVNAFPRKTAPRSNNKSNNKSNDKSNDVCV